MPIFEYECAKCKHVTSFLEKAGAEGPHACEKCGSKKTEKLFSSFSPMNAAPPAPEPAGCAQCPSQMSCPSRQ